jgi:predicted amidohydrolase YtcJ
MTPPRASLVVIGQVLVNAGPDGTQIAEALGMADGRVVAVGGRSEMLDAAAAGARVLDMGDAAVVPGLCDFHLHLVGMARARREVRLDEARSGEELIGAMHAAAAKLPPDGWLRGRGWHEETLSATDLDRLDQAIGRRPALVYSHDGHSAWASPAALSAAGIEGDTADPAGGRLERHADGRLNGILRERATDLLDPVGGGLSGPGLDEALAETLAELASLGVTAAVDAGDATDDGGSGQYAALGDRASALLDSPVVDGRLRLSVNLPAAAIRAATALRLRTGVAIPDRETIRLGWAKVFVDGALGSRTAAVFEPYTCGDAGDSGITRLDAGELDEIVAAARRADIGLAIHAIGDRGVAMVLDALERGPARGRDVPPDRIEHLQLMRAPDTARLAAADITASIQPVHCASDRPLVESCWTDRAARAYPWRDLQRAGTRLAFGSDAPIESPNPWLGMFAAAHRRFPGDGSADWRPEQSIEPAAALAAYTSGPASAGQWPDQGHLQAGAQADLAVLNVGLDVLLRGGEELETVRSQLTLVGGSEVPAG